MIFDLIMLFELLIICALLVYVVCMLVKEYLRLKKENAELMEKLDAFCKGDVEITITKEDWDAFCKESAELMEKCDARDKKAAELIAEVDALYKDNTEFLKECRKMVCEPEGNVPERDAEQYEAYHVASLPEGTGFCQINGDKSQ